MQSFIFKGELSVFLLSEWKAYWMLLFCLSLANEICAINYRPRFSRNPVITSVVENSPTGTSITKISNYAIDDEGDAMTYSLDVVGLSYCTIDQFTGLVSLKTSLDRELQERITFNAYAEDNFEGGGATRRASLMVFIYVLDVNEWAPEFKETPYIGSIPENASIGYSVLTLSATDKDQGSNAEFVFAFKEGTQIPQFSLNPSGQIQVAGQLDYEAVNRYTLSVVAKDKGTPSLYSETRVIIDITDIGDTKPIFTPSSSYEAKVNENLPLNSEVIKITASDGDKGVNNVIGYEICQGNDAGLFVIDSTTGKIKVNGTLDREKASLFSLKIKAYEIPVPSSYALADVIIQLNDLNDHKPSFKANSYYFTIDEDKQAGFVMSPSLKATDKDISIKNSAFQYSIVDNSGKFAIEPTNGQLYVNGKLDYETKLNYTFMAFATETLSSEKQSGNTTVIITLQNVNDNSPIFTQMNYIFNITENSPVGTIIGNVTAFDDDAGSFGEVSYSISTSLTSSLFKIYPISGAISVLSLPDYESTKSQTFDIKATDGGGSVSRSSTVSVTVFIIDENDNYPVFENLPGNIFVSENKPAHKILTVKAVDKDSGTFGIVNYKLEHTGLTEFLLNSTTGELFATKELDYEGVKNIYQLYITALDNGIPTRRDTTRVLTVTVKDENDHRPTFNQSIYNVSITENSKVGSIIMKLSAVDYDSGLNSKLSYVISKGNERNTFTISSAGEIKTQAPLDRENKESYELLIIVSDQGTPSLSANTTVFIKITDDNDNYPNFQPPSYSVKVNETTPVGTEVVTLQTDDKDVGENARISYSIVSGNDKGHFVLNETTGKLLINQPLDWEATTNYILNVKAEDHGIPRKSRTAFVTIEVLDNNDNPPIFTESKYSFQIYENTVDGRSVGRVTADDKDGKLPPNQNGIVKYFITSGDERGSFKIDENIGIISTNRSIDRESSSYYNLTITAIDGGLPAQFAQVYVLVEILDQNDNPPLFSCNNYSTTVYENASIGFHIKQVSAADADTGINARVAYEITSGNVNDDFTIDSNGVIIIAKELDRETTQNYSLAVTAKDYGSPQRSSTVHVFIGILDVNDNKPVFFGTPHAVYVPEEHPAGLFITQVKAKDADYGQNSLISFNIISSTPSNVFSINKTNGIITTTDSLDREGIPVYRLNISASDSGTTPQTTYTNLIVNVIDINDHVPRILNLPNRTYVSEGVKTGISIFKVGVSDGDSGSNAALSFSITSGAEKAFSMNKVTGEVVVLRSLDRETRDKYILAVNVTDSGSPTLWSTGVLEITVTDINDNVPIFHPDPIRNSAFYTRNIQEGAGSVGVIIIQVNATDEDSGKNGMVTYRIISGDEANLFSIDSISGEIKVNSTIDRESVSVVKNAAGLGVFSLIIKASDQAEISPKSASTTVTIIITDINDNRPVFSKPRYFAGVSEGADILSRVITLTATDKDIGLSGRVKYSIIDGNVNGDFAIVNPYDGAITVARVLNAETTCVYNLTIMATDDGDLAGGTSRNSTTTVTITIGDLNDNDPVFNQTSYTASIKENISGKQHVLTVFATDADQGSNGEIWYQITSGNDDQAFYINNKTGSIYSMVAMDRESVAKYTVIVKAEDMGTPSTRKASVEVVIHIEDVNDNPPKFKSSVYIGQVKENSLYGTPIALSPSLSLEDADKDAKGQTTLRISGKGAENFFINSTTLTLIPSKTSKLDREKEPIYYLTMTAIDNDGLSSKASLIVVVNDMNDNRPLFNHSQFNVTLREDSAIGTVVLNAEASDIDAGSNSLISYSLRGGDGVLSLNRTTGVILLNNKLDRETQEEYTVTLVASDQGIPSLESQAIVHIKITDVIDFAPYFEPSIVQLNINESTPNNSIIFTVRAKDMDENDHITYNLTMVSVSGKFRLDAVSGELKLVNSLDREINSQYQLNIQATDSASLSSPTNGLIIKINVLDTNDNSPQFLQPFYLNDVVENTLDGTIIMSVLASDPDQGANGRVVYSIKENTHGLLRISSGTGLISKHGVWKITAGGYLNFTVIAKDGGNPPRQASVSCSIRWITINAVNPRFNQSTYSIALKEDSANGGNVLQLIAYKKGRMEPMVYSMTGGKGNFIIDRNNGMIRIANPLDREQQERYALTVTATDSESLTGVTSVTITVLDVNDNSPVFSSETYMWSIVEDVKMFEAIGNVLAVDRDSGENSVVEYSIVNGNERNWFIIDANNGTISINHTLDRETQEFVELKIMARDHGIPPRNVNATVKITLLDVNDNVPTFTEKSYNVSVIENIPGDSQIFLLNAVDGDKSRNGSVSYYAESGNEMGYFYIGRSTGSINIAKLLDHEKEHSFTLSIRASDNGIPKRLSSTTTVHITVVDVNDNTPRFLSPSYHFSVQENAPPGHIIGKVQAKDTDANFNEVYYKIVGQSSSSAFVISEINGTIELTRPLDRETADTHQLTIQAYNKDKFGNNSLASSVKVSIQVTDVNDHRPTFPISCCNASVYENANIGDVILRVSASDLDVGPNKALSYKIVQGNEKGYFKIDEVLGDIRVKVALDREIKSSYELLVNAEDHGTPSLSQNTTVHIKVLDVNDVKPAFQPINISVIKEDAEIGTLITTIKAIDEDEGENGQVTLEILAGIDDGSFTLNPNTGQLRIAKILDYERVNKYKLRIIARDHGVPSLSSIETFIINIANINDNVPKFATDKIDAFISENVPPGSVVTMISASDADNDQIYFYIKEGNQDLFQMNEMTGLITTKKILDREVTPQFTLTVEATNIKKSANSVTRMKRADSSTNQNNTPTQTVIINVKDQNDNAPKFTQVEYRAGVSENAKYGTSVIQVIALDADSGINSSILYSIIEKKPSDSFTIDSKTGWIKSAQLFAGKVGQNFQVKVLAQDNNGNQPNFNDTVIAKIFVLTDIQRVVLTMGVDPQLVRDNKAEFIRVLQNMTSFKINIDDIQYSKKDGVYDTSSTDLTFHAVDPITNEIQERDVVIKALERNEGKYKAFFDKWKVKSVKAIVVSKTSSAQDDNTSMLIGVAAGLFLLVVPFIFALCYLRRKQRRKLKAATASAKQSDATLELEHIQELHNIVTGSVSGKKSNVSQASRSLSKASERFYPIWIEPTDESVRKPLLISFHKSCSSASYFSEDNSGNSISNTKTMTSEILMMPNPYLDETDVDYYLENEDLDHIDNVSDLFDSLYDESEGDTVIYLEQKATENTQPSREELLLRASLQPLATLENKGMHVTAI